VSYIVAGTRLSWSGDFANFAFISQTSGDTIQIVGSALKNKYNLIVERSTNVGDWSGLGAKTITLDLREDTDRNSEEDIRGNVMGEFAAAGAPCTNSRIISITPPGGQATPTGAPSAPPPTVAPPKGSSGGGCVGFWDCISNGQVGDAFGNLAGQAEAGTLGFIVGGIAIVGLILYLGMRDAA
jgi:hypothetical protein